MSCPYCGYSIAPANATTACYVRQVGDWHVRLTHAWCKPNVSCRPPAKPSARLRKRAYLARVDGYYPPKVRGSIFDRNRGRMTAAEMRALPGAF